MVDKKPTVKKRPVAMKTLHTAVTKMVADTDGLTDASSIGDLLEAIKDAWFEQA